MPERYPNIVVEVFHGFAVLALLFGGAAALLVLTAWDRAGDNRPLTLLIAFGIVFATALAWAVFKTAALVVTYLWVIQDQVSGRERDRQQVA